MKVGLKVSIVSVFIEQRKERKEIELICMQESDGDLITHFIFILIVAALEGGPLSRFLLAIRPWKEGIKEEVR